MLLLLGALELPAFAQVGLDALVGVDQALALAGQLQGLTFGAGKQDDEVIRDSQAALEDCPCTGRGRDADLRGFDDHRQARGVIRPADLVWTERRRLLEFRLARLDLDP